jgi:hypothetical protein
VPSRLGVQLNSRRGAAKSPSCPSFSAGEEGVEAGLEAVVGRSVGT